MGNWLRGDVVILKRGDRVRRMLLFSHSDSLELDGPCCGPGENDPVLSAPAMRCCRRRVVLGGTGRVLLSHVDANSRASKISDRRVNSRVFRPLSCVMR